MTSLRRSPGPSRPPRPPLGLALAALVAACGYTVGAVRPANGPRALRVEAIEERGIDVDAAAQVARAVRRRVAMGPSTRLEEDAPEAVLSIRLLDARHALSPMSDPRLRAAEYVAQVRLLGTLSSTVGRSLWRSPVVVGEAHFMSMPGSMESLDGARRRALAQAAEQAADRLLTHLVHAP